MSTEKETNAGKDPDSSRRNDKSSTETQFSEHVLLQRAGRTQTLASNIKDLLAMRRVRLAGEASSDHLLRKVAHFDEHHSRSQVFSVAVHGGLGLVIFLAIALELPPSINPISNPRWLVAPAPAEFRRATQQPLLEPGKGHGGGGENNPIPVSLGQLPPSSMRDQLAPPSLIRNPIPKLPVQTTLIGPEQFTKPNPDLPWGDPNAQSLTNSNGPGLGPGMGSHGRGGIGDVDGPGSGRDPEYGVSRIYRDGEGMRSPECAYCPRPEYSDEARKAKYQGSVLLNVVVLPDGKTARIEIVSSPGMGLDEKAIEAVRNWRFRPGLGPNGKPAAITVTIEVVFQLF
jgi:protein TonB